MKMRRREYFCDLLAAETARCRSRRKSKFSRISILLKCGGCVAATAYAASGCVCMLPKSGCLALRVGSSFGSLHYVIVATFPSSAFSLPRLTYPRHFGVRPRVAWGLTPRSMLENRCLTDILCSFRLRQPKFNAEHSWVSARTIS